MYVKFIGELFLNMLQGIMIPLIMPSLITTIGSMNIRLSRKLGLRAIAYYLSTTAIAVILGIILVVTIRPGEIDEENMKGGETESGVMTEDTMMDLIRNLFPPNIIQATLKQHSTEIIPVSHSITLHTLNPFFRITPLIKILGKSTTTGKTTQTL